MQNITRLSPTSCYLLRVRLTLEGGEGDPNSLCVYCLLIISASIVAPVRFTAILIFDPLDFLLVNDRHLFAQRIHNSFHNSDFGALQEFKLPALACRLKA